MDGSKSVLIIDSQICEFYMQDSQSVRKLENLGIPTSPNYWAYHYTFQPQHILSDIHLEQDHLPA